MNVLFKKILNRYSELPWERKILWSAAGLALIPITAAWLLKSASHPETPAIQPSAADVDTYIPRGFVLVPIDVQNYEALDSILGKFGVVDLLQTPNPEHPEAHVVARHVRILRAPQNPSHFAILIAEEGVREVLRFGSQFTVLVRGKTPVGTEFVKEESRREIVYEGK